MPNNDDDDDISRKITGSEWAFDYTGPAGCNHLSREHMTPVHCCVFQKTFQNFFYLTSLLIVFNFAVSAVH